MNGREIMSGKRDLCRSGSRWALVLLVIAASTGLAATISTGGEVVEDLEARVLRGRALVIASGCGDCHGGLVNPAAEGWLAGQRENAMPAGSLTVYPRNLTPDPETGIGRFTDRQIFNALRFGLRPGETPDVEITSPVPGVGNHPVEPRYLAPPMPWSSFRHMPDQDIRDVIAYLRHGVRPVHHRLEENAWPDDGWASAFTEARAGAYPAPPFPTAYEREPTVATAAAAPGAPRVASREQIQHGRKLVTSHACGACHGGLGPGMEGWLSGSNAGHEMWQEFQLGPFLVRPRNITPDNLTGIGRFSERQIFNAMRYGLRPGETADVEITSGTPGVGNHPENPKYLAPAMPWTAFRNLADHEIWDIAAYLKYGVVPVSNRVPDSEGPPDFWAGAYDPEVMGTHPPPPFPTARERRPE